MDATIMSQVGLGGGVVGVLSIAFAIFKYINHRTIRSKCCGHTGEVGIDIDTPKTDTAKETAVEVKRPEVVPV